MGKQLFINDKQVDLKDFEPIGVREYGNGLYEQNERKSVHSFSFTLPKTPTNNLIMSNAFDVNSLDINNVGFGRLVPAKLFVDGALYANGNIALTEVVKEGYKVVFYSEVSSIFAAFGEKTLKEFLHNDTTSTYFKSRVQLSAENLYNHFLRLANNHILRWTLSESMMYDYGFLNSLEIPPDHNYTYYHVLHTYLYDVINGNAAQTGDLIKFAQGYNTDNVKNQTKLNYKIQEHDLAIKVAQNQRVGFYLDVLLKYIFGKIGWKLEASEFVKKDNPYFSRLVLLGKIITENIRGINQKVRTGVSETVTVFQLGNINKYYYPLPIINEQSDIFSYINKTVTIDGNSVPVTVLKIKKDVTPQCLLRLAIPKLKIGVQFPNVGHDYRADDPDIYTFNFVLVKNNVQTVLESRNMNYGDIIVPSLFAEDGGQPYIHTFSALNIFRNNVKSKKHQFTIAKDDEIFLYIVITRKNDAFFVNLSGGDDISSSNSHPYLRWEAGEFALDSPKVPTKHDVLPLSEFLPDIKIKDLLTSYIRYFGLYPVISKEKKEIRFLTRNEYYIDEVVDINPYFCANEEWQILPGNKYNVISFFLNPDTDEAKRNYENYGRTVDEIRLIIDKSKSFKEEYNYFKDVIFTSIATKRIKGDEYGYYKKNKMMVVASKNEKAANPVMVLMDGGVDFDEIEDTRLPDGKYFQFVDITDEQAFLDAQEFPMEHWSATTNDVGYLVLTKRVANPSYVVDKSAKARGYKFCEKYENGGNVYGITISPLDEANEEGYIFDRFFKRYTTDRYSSDNKVFEGKFLLPVALQNNICRRFYYFKNRLWVCEVAEIGDLGVNSPVKLTLVSVVNKENYLNGVDLGLAIRYKVTFIVKYNNVGVAGAIVTFGDKVGVTESNGEVEFINVEQKEYSYTISKAGYHTYTDNVTITDNTTIEISLIKGLYTPEQITQMIQQQGFIPVATAAELNALHNNITQQMGAGT
ncbi:MAG: carboxypeptidase-like regulatory domain-containing protein, partial [candidate division WOR-3 bacterium]